MSLPNAPADAVSAAPRLALLRAYQGPVLATSLWQVLSTFGLYALCVALMYAALHVSVWLTLALALPASGLIVRIFMLQHDCGHGSLFCTRRTNEAVGLLCSLVTLTPFVYWRRLHARHHRSWNNLDERGIPADFFSDCATLREFDAMAPLKRALYRATHHPLLMHFVLPPVIFILLYRVPFDTPWANRREHVSVYLLNLALLSKRAKPSRVPSHKYPSRVCVMTLTVFCGKPASVSHARMTKPADGVGSLVAACDFAIANQQQATTQKIRRLNFNGERKRCFLSAAGARRNLLPSAQTSQTARGCKAISRPAARASIFCAKQFSRVLRFWFETQRRRFMLAECEGLFFYSA